MDNDFEIFKKKTFSGLCKDIYTNSTSKKNQIDIIIGELRVLIKTVDDALIVVPMIVSCLDTGVHNDDQLIKLAAVVQRFVSGIAASDGEGNALLTEEEKNQLLNDVKQEVESMNGEDKSADKELTKITKQVDKVKQELDDVNPLEES